MADDNDKPIGANPPEPEKKEREEAPRDDTKGDDKDSKERDDSDKDGKDTKADDAGSPGSSPSGSGGSGRSNIDVDKEGLTKRVAELREVADELGGVVEKVNAANEVVKADASQHTVDSNPSPALTDIIKAAEGALGRLTESLGKAKETISKDSDVVEKFVLDVSDVEDEAEEQAENINADV